MRHLGVFAKYWQPGHAKTRLAAATGSQAAAELHREFLLTTLARLAGHAEVATLVYTPEAQRGQFADLLGENSSWMLQAQSSGHLGERMDAFFRAAFENGAQRVALIGSDTPHLPPNDIDDAFRLLDRVPVVLGPSDDGGYYLVAARDTAPPIFGTHDWGSPRVYDQTVAALSAAGMDYELLPLNYDIDLPEDLARLHAELALSTDPQLQSLRSRIDILRSG